MLRSTLSSWREYLTPVTHKSTFEETGEITPEEFVEAGDYLVYKFPTWQWSSAPPNKKRDFLPDDKQFLVTHRVPSYARAAELTEEQVDGGGPGTEDDDEEDGWTNAAVGFKKLSSKSRLHDNGTDSTDARPVSEENNDIDALIDESADIDNEDNDHQHQHHYNANKRSYDLYITYSTSYRVPKLYLVGFDADGSPLSPDRMFEDISPDYRQKTATIEKAPFLSNTTSVSVHPCKHANVMRVLMARATQRNIQNASSVTEGVHKLGIADNNDEWEDVNTSDTTQQGIRVDQYLIIFLKFISSVTPGIEHDYTMDATF
ncbi:hypothetical protein LJB42_002597 [Komagataella kurtzmanii]|nr:hypothetical protein LJB42_002597 [Komagataella kurtzmanii]